MGTDTKRQAEVRAGIIKSLAHPSRVLMIDALAQGERCVCELADLIGADISTASKHLSLLKAAGLVAVEKRGLNQYYRAVCPCLSAFFACVDSISAAKAASLTARPGRPAAARSGRTCPSRKCRP